MLKNQNIKLSSSTYLLSCDSINKYNLLSIYKQPKISKIILSISLKQIQENSYFYSTDENLSSDLKIRTFLLFFLLLGSSPYIVFQNIKVLKDNRSKRNDGDFILKITIKNSDRISSFLSDLCLENNFLKNTSEFELFQPLFQSQIQNNNSKGSFNIKLPADFFFDINEFFLYKVQNLDLSRIKFNTNFVYENFPKDKNIQKVLQNTLYFN